MQTSYRAGRLNRSMTLSAGSRRPARRSPQDTTRGADESIAPDQAGSPSRLPQGQKEIPDCNAIEYSDFPRRRGNMRALCWHGKSDVRVDTVPDPEDRGPARRHHQDHLHRICGSDLHLYDGYMPTMEAGDILGHEPMGVVVEVGKDVKKLKKGDRVVVPFTISCGECWFCKRTDVLALRQLQPQRRDRPQGDGPVAGGPVRLLAHARRLSPAARPSTSACPTPTSARSRSPTACPTRRSLFLSDIFPTGYMAAENAEIEPGDTVAVWGCGPVGPVRHPQRLDARRRAGHRHRPRARAAGDGRRHGKAETIDFEKQDVYDTLDGDDQGPRARTAASTRSGAEAHAGGSLDAVIDKAKAAVGLATDRPHVAARGDHVLPQGRHGLDPRRLRRLPGQDPVRAPR